eukprot:TRINITY_DN6113_c0_g1_i1.p2 TRINITY_DN6113_c0_g1~~TRINITY_DN6113_c0_g1_i1.p2  ORF type:complete len:145 (-),score=37.72 TRINITY_DN6113_c0_g1_i1:86-520(-)
MAKSKNHTAHNQSRKAHRNGIKKPPQHRDISHKAMDPKFVRNQRYAVKKNVVFKKKQTISKAVAKPSTKAGVKIQKARSFLHKGWGRDLVALERSLRAGIPFKEQWRRLNQQEAASKLNRNSIRAVTKIAKKKADKKNAKAEAK